MLPNAIFHLKCRHRGFLGEPDTFGGQRTSLTATIGHAMIVVDTSIVIIGYHHTDQYSIRRLSQAWLQATFLLITIQICMYKNTDTSHKGNRCRGEERREIPFTG